MIEKLGKGCNCQNNNIFRTHVGFQPFFMPMKLYFSLKRG